MGAVSHGAVTDCFFSFFSSLALKALLIYFKKLLMTIRVVPKHSPTSIAKALGTRVEAEKMVAAYVRVGRYIEIVPSLVDMGVNRL